MNEFEQLKQRITVLESVLGIRSDRLVFPKDLQFQDGRNILFSGATGTKIGTKASQKFAFYGIDPRDQYQANYRNATTNLVVTNLYGTFFSAGLSWNQMTANMLNHLWQMAIGLGLLREVDA